MLRNDELETIYLHLHSLANLRIIGERMPQPTEDTAPPQDEAATDDEVAAADDTIRTQRSTALNRLGL